MIVAMSETTSSVPEPETGPVTTTTSPAYVEPERRSRLSTVAAWVGIVAGVVFIVAVVFFSGFILGAHSGGHRGGHHHGGGNHQFGMIHRGPPPMFGGPGGGFQRPPFGGPGSQPGGPGSQPGGPGAQSPSPTAPTTPAPARP